MYGIKNIFMSYTLSLWIHVVIYNCITKLYIVNSERFICNQPVRSPVDLYEKYTRIYLLNSPLYVESMGLRTYSYQTFQASEFRCSLNCITLIVYCNCTSLTWSDWYVINQLEVQFNLQNWVDIYDKYTRIYAEPSIESWLIIRRWKCAGPVVLFRNSWSFFEPYLGVVEPFQAQVSKLGNDPRGLCLWHSPRIGLHLEKIIMDCYAFKWRLKMGVDQGPDRWNLFLFHFIWFHFYWLRCQWRLTSGHWASDSTSWRVVTLRRKLRRRSVHFPHSR